MKTTRYVLFIVWLSAICAGTKAQQISRFLSVDELFRLGMESNIQIKSANMKEQMAEKQLKSAIPRFWKPLYMQKSLTITYGLPMSTTQECGLPKRISNWRKTMSGR